MLTVGRGIKQITIFFLATGLTKQEAGCWASWEPGRQSVTTWETPRSPLGAHAGFLGGLKLLLVAPVPDHVLPQQPPAHSEPMRLKPALNR